MGPETPPPGQKPLEAASAASKEALAAASPAKVETKRPELAAQFPALGKMKPRDDEPRAEQAVDEYANTVVALGPEVIKKAEEARDVMIAKMRATG